MSNTQTQNKRQIGQLNHKKRLVPIYEDYDKNDVKVGVGTYRKPNGEIYIKLDEIPTTTAYTAKTINGNDIVTDNGKIYGNSQEEANTKYGRYRLTHPNETARRTDQYMAQKYGSGWRDYSKYGMKPTMEAFNAVTAGMLNRLSPTQNIRAVYDLATNPVKGFKGLINGNNGIVTDKFAQEHPFWSLGANLGGDIITLGGPSLYNASKNAITNSRPYKVRQIAKEIKKNVDNNDGKHIREEDLVDQSKFYRITQSPEIEDIKELGKNVTTTDGGYSRNQRYANSIIKNKLVWNPKLEGYVKTKGLYLNKFGSAHGNRTQAAKGETWKGGVAVKPGFKNYIIEGNLPYKVDARVDGHRSNFIKAKSEFLPSGYGIGFKSGEMPTDNLRLFRFKNINGKINDITYEGPLIKDKRIYMQYPKNPTISYPVNKPQIQPDSPLLLPRKSYKYGGTNK